MQNIFQQVPIKRRSLLQVIFNQHPDENAVIQLNNLLASKGVKGIFKNDINAIETKYKIVLKEEFPLNLEEFYAVYLNQCLRNAHLSDDEIADLTHLKDVLSIDEDTIKELHQLIGISVYREAFQESIKDGVVDNLESKKLQDLRSSLDLSDTSVQITESIAKSNYINQRALDLINSLQFSPADEEDLIRLAKNLNVDLKFDSNIRKQLDRLESYWVIENSQLKPIEVNADLQKTEICYITIPGVKWFDLKTGTTSKFSSIEESIKLTKRTYLKTGSLRPVKYHASEMKLIQTGTIYLTNKRILMVGSLKNSNVRLDKIGDFIPFEDSVEIRKDTGKNPLLVFPKNGDLFTLVLGRLLLDQNS